MVFRHNDLGGPTVQKSLSMFTDLSTIFNKGLKTNRNAHHMTLGVSGHQQLNLFVIGAYGTKQKHKSCLFSSCLLLFSLTKKKILFRNYFIFHQFFTLLSKMVFSQSGQC